MIQIIASMFKYILHLPASKTGLLKETIESSEELSNKGIDSWVHFIKSTLCLFLDMRANTVSDIKQLYKKVYKALNSKHISIRNKKVNSSTRENEQRGNKLRSYCHFKQHFGMKKYLQFKQ